MWMGKFKLYKSLETSDRLNGCETWTLLADFEKKRIQAVETKCLRKLFHISNLEHRTSDWVQSNINSLVCSQEPLLATVSRRKLAWFGHVTRHDSLSKTILHGTFEGGQRKCWTDNIEEWTSLPMPEVLTRASCRKDWKRISAESFLMSPRRSNRFRNRTDELLWPVSWCVCRLASLLVVG